MILVGVGLIAYGRIAYISKYRGNRADCAHDRFDELTVFLLAIKSANFLTAEILPFLPVAEIPYSSPRRQLTSLGHLRICQKISLSFCYVSRNLYI